MFSCVISESAGVEAGLPWRPTFSCARGFSGLRGGGWKGGPPFRGTRFVGDFLGGHFDQPSFSLLSGLVLLGFLGEAFASMNGDPPRQAGPAVRDSGMTH